MRAQATQQATRQSRTVAARGALGGRPAAVWMIVPLALTLYFSFQQLQPARSRHGGFAGFDNYKYFLTDPAFCSALIEHARPGRLGAGHHRRARRPARAAARPGVFGRGIVRLLVIAPFFVMPTVSALIWKNLLMHPVYGLLRLDRHARSGCSRSTGSPTIRCSSIILIVAWQWLPFATLILLTALQSLDERAEGSGARWTAPSALSMFFYIIAAASRAADHRGDHDRDDLPADGLRRDLRHHRGGRASAPPTSPS